MRRSIPSVDLGPDVETAPGPTRTLRAEAVRSSRIRTARHRAVRIVDSAGILPDLIAAAVAIGAIVFLADPRFNLRIMVFLSCGWSMFTAVRRGRRYLTPSGIFFLSSGVFIGLACHYLLEAGTVNDWESLRAGATWAFLSTLGISMFTTVFEARSRTRWPASDDLPRAEVGNPPEFFLAKAALMVLISQIPPVKSALGPIATAIGLGGVMMAVLATSNRRLKIRWIGDAVMVLVAVAAPFVWMRFEFTGGGRLTLAGLGIASLLVWNISRPRPIHKVAVFVALPIFLIFAGTDRLGDDSRISGSSVISSGGGLESMYSPLDTFVELTGKTFEDDGPPTGPQWGKTFYAAAVIPVPRTLWEDKPVGFGAQLTEMLRWRLLTQNRISPTHSMAALSQGEWYSNFGWPGLVAMTLPLGWLLALFDRWHSRLAWSQLKFPSNWWSMAALACVCSSLGDLMWVGSFTFMARGGLAALVLAVIWAFSSRRPRLGFQGRPRAAVPAHAMARAHRLGTALPGAEPGPSGELSSAPEPQDAKQ